MTESMDLKNLLEVTAKILIWCFILNFALALLWFCFQFFGSGQWGYGFLAQIFDITKHEFVLINYCGIAFVKVCNIIFFLFPYLAIRLVLRRHFGQ